MLRQVDVRIASTGPKATRDRWRAPGQKAPLATIGTSHSQAVSGAHQPSRRGRGWTDTSPPIVGLHHRDQARQAVVRNELDVRVDKQHPVGITEVDVCEGGCLRIDAVGDGTRGDDVCTGAPRALRRLVVARVVDHDQAHIEVLAALSSDRGEHDIDVSCLVVSRDGHHHMAARGLACHGQRIAKSSKTTRTCHDAEHTQRALEHRSTRHRYRASAARRFSVPSGSGPTGVASSVVTPARAQASSLAATSASVPTSVSSRSNASGTAASAPCRSWAR